MVETEWLHNKRISSLEIFINVLCWIQYCSWITCISTMYNVLLKIYQHGRASWTTGEHIKWTKREFFIALFESLFERLLVCADWDNGQLLEFFFNKFWKSHFKEIRCFFPIGTMSIANSKEMYNWALSNWVKTINKLWWWYMWSNLSWRSVGSWTLWCCHLYHKSLLIDTWISINMINGSKNIIVWQNAWVDDKGILVHFVRIPWCMSPHCCKTKFQLDI
jgi:hypothetical protein